MNMLRSGALALVYAVTLVAPVLTAAPAVAADQALIDAAKKEGEVTWYTTLVIDQFARPAADAFEKQYGIKVNYVRAVSTEVALRLLNEAKAGRVMADVVDGTSVSLALKREKLLLDWVPDAATRFGPQYVDREGYWIATNQYVMTPGFNTDLVPKGTEPKSYQDLLDPKWKGKMAWASSPGPSSAHGFVGLILTYMGEERGITYLRELANQDITDVGLDAGRALLNEIIAGEHAIALQIFNNHAVISAQLGAPSAWIAMQPVMSYFSVASVTSGAPHPNAAKLLLDFLVSGEGQQIFRDADYIPVDPDVPPRDPSLRPDNDKLRALYFTPEELELSMPHWVDAYKQIFQ